MSSNLSAKSPSSGLALKPSELWRMFKERWWVGLLAGVFVGVVVYLLMPQSPAEYRTEASMLFEQRKDRVLNMREVVDTSLQSAAELNTHMETIRSASFLSYLLVSFTAEETARIQEAYRDPENPTKALPALASLIAPNLSVYARRGTNILAVAVTNRDPDSAALIANRIVRKYIDFNLDRANTGTNTAIVFLRNQSDDLRRQVESAEEALQSYRAKHNMAALGENQNVVIQKMSSLGAALVTAELELVRLQATKDNISRFTSESRPLHEIPAIASFDLVAKALSSIDSLTTNRTLLGEKYLRRHPLMRENEASLAEARRLLEEGVSRAVLDVTNRSVLSAKYVAQLRGEIAATETEVRELDRISVDFKFLQEEAATKRRAFVNIIDRLNETSITSQLENASIRVFDQAWVPSLPTADHLGPRNTVSASLALFITIALPLGWGLLDTRVKSTSQIESSLGERLLGVLPRIKKLSEAERSQAFIGNKDDRVVEAYRGLYGEIEIGSAVAYPKSLLVTSSIPGEGKSLVASNLAATFASHGRRVLLVDCDLRRPTLYRYFAVEPEPGWVQWLTKPEAQREPVPAGIVNVAERFDLLPAGGAPTQSTQIIEQLSRAETQSLLLARYDLVIFDTPPTTVFPDAVLLARSCHELLYVCRHGMVSVGTVRRALAHLRATGVRGLGMVLNCAPNAAGLSDGYYGYGTRAAKYYKAYAQRDSDD